MTFRKLFSPLLVNSIAALTFLTAWILQAHPRTVIGILIGAVIRLLAEIVLDSADLFRVTVWEKDNGQTLFVLAVWAQTTESHTNRGSYTWAFKAKTYNDFLSMFLRARPGSRCAGRERSRSVA